ncbi:MAG: hypothetical protein IKB60_03305 [Clostridia bacterium]|nr:hypothetical protein [Clostridia bacterium]
MRKAMVTRTIQTTVANCLCVNPETREVTEMSLTLSGTFKDLKSLEKAVNKVTENAPFRVVSITDSRVEETLYGMTEQKFIENADILPPRATKENN